MKLSSCMLLPLLLRHIISSCMKERSFSTWVPFPFSLSFYFKHFSSGKMQSWWNTHLGITPSLRSSLTVDIFNFNWNIFLYCHMHDEIVVAAWQTFLSIFFKKSKTLCTGTWAMLKFFLYDLFPSHPPSSLFLWNIFLFLNDRKLSSSACCQNVMREKFSQKIKENSKDMKNFLSSLLFVTTKEHCRGSYKSLRYCQLSSLLKFE